MKYILKENNFYSSIGSKIKGYLDKLSDNFFNNNDIHKIICELIMDIKEIGAENPKSEMLKNELFEILVGSYDKTNNKKEFFEELKKCFEKQDKDTADLFVQIINDECKKCEELNQVMENIIEQENYNMETDQFVNMIEKKLGKELNHNIKLEFYNNSDLLTCIDNQKIEIENKLKSLEDIKLFIKNE